MTENFDPVLREDVALGLQNGLDELHAAVVVTSGLWFLDEELGTLVLTGPYGRRIASSTETLCMRKALLNSRSTSSGLLRAYDLAKSNFPVAFCSCVIFVSFYVRFSRLMLSSTMQPSVCEKIQRAFKRD